MPAAKKRKVTGTAVKTGASTTKSIAAFTKVSKSQVISKSTFDKQVLADNVVTSISDQRIGTANKRKLREKSFGAESDQNSTLPPTSIELSQRHIKLLPARRSNYTQILLQTPRKSDALSAVAGPADTPTKGASILFNKLFLSSSPTTLSSPQSDTPRDKYIDSSQSSINEHHINQIADELPSELVDLVNLHSAFLTALTLHYAHNGTHTPADLRLLCPDVARAWGKRKVVVDDVRRTLGILNTSIVKDDQAKVDGQDSSLTLSNYGHGKLCVEIKAIGGRGGKMARPLNEQRLNEEFKCNIRRLWKEDTNENNNSVSRFLESLPLENITVCSSLAKMSPLLARGQRRLESFRAGGVQRKEADKAKSYLSHLKEGEGERPTLLERLKAKQLHQSTLPAPLSKAELGRKAALHRLDEVIAVLTLLTTSTSVGQQRVSFTLPTVLGKLRDSFKTPMSKEEGDTCVRLLAAEIAPEWLRVVKLGKLDAVVVNRDNRPSDLDIQERVKRAGQLFLA